MNKLLPYQTDNVLEVGIDEAGRGCLFGRLYVAGVILPNNILELCEEEDIIIKDSKKMNRKNKERARKFIEKNAIDYNIIYKDNNYIDEKNILRATMHSMHDVVRGLNIQPEKILVDGDHFNLYTNSEGEIINHECIIEGDNKYMSIAAASILAKTYKDEYIENIVKEYPDLAKYDLLANSGYGTKSHIEAIKINGISEFHRKTFGICKQFI
jgi:ribonuclease HII